MNRRTFIRANISVIPTGCLAGCLSLFSPGSVGLHVLNWSAQKQTFDVQIEDRNDEARYSERITLSGGESARREDILSGGRYIVTISVQEGPTEEYEFRMGECEEQEITVIYENPTELEIARKQC